MQWRSARPTAKTRRLEVKIPAGRADRLALGSRTGRSGQGGARPATSISSSRWLPIRRFERRGDDLHTEVRAPLQSLLLGGEARVPRRTGGPSRCRSRPAPRMAGLPTPRARACRASGAANVRGDLHAAVHAQLPERLTKRQRELIEEFARSGAEATDGAVRR
jgi:molecular chaperone DnaJ